MKQSFLFEVDNFGFRPVSENDLNYFQMLDADPETMSFFPSGVRSTQEIKDKIKKYVTGYEKKGYGVFLVFDLTLGEFIARAGFDDVESGEIEVGYVPEFTPRFIHQDLVIFCLQRVKFLFAFYSMSQYAIF